MNIFPPILKKEKGLVYTNSEIFVGYVNIFLFAQSGYNSVRIGFLSSFGIINIQLEYYVDYQDMVR
jgi:hypothetical protein